MKKFRFFSAVLAISMLISTVSYADFSDMPENAELKVAIENAVKNGILSGYEDGTVRPDNNITRAEMASIITRACGATAEADISKFSDVSADSWYYSAFAKAYGMGAFSGDDQKHMNPNNNITFQECFTILSQVFEFLPPYTIVREQMDTIPEDTVLVLNSVSRLYDVSVLKNYADGASVAEWAKVFVSGILANGGWNGENGNITPTAYITRGQFATVMNNLVQNYIDTPGTYSELPAGNTMIRCDGVALEGLSFKDRIFIADGVSQGGVTVKDVDLGRFIIRGCATPFDENGQLANNDFGIELYGKFENVRIIRPYVSVNLLGAEYGGLYAAEGSHTAFLIQ